MTPHEKLFEAKVIEILKNTKKELEHGLETKKWVLELYPTCDWEVQIAALAHDIERAVPEIPNMTPPRIGKLEDEDYEIWKTRHSNRSAGIMEHLMKTYLFSDDQIERVKKAISNHDTLPNTNNLDAIAVQDGDSVRFFETGLPNYINAFGLESAKIKAQFMYAKASQLAKARISTIQFDSEVKKCLG